MMLRVGRGLIREKRKKLKTKQFYHPPPFGLSLSEIFSLTSPQSIQEPTRNSSNIIYKIKKKNNNKKWRTWQDDSYSQ